MTKTYTVRRTQDQWKAVVEQWQQSGQSARQFCEEHNLGYVSFCQWRKRLAKDLPGSSQQDSGASFIDLASLASVSGSSSGWQIVLSLGNGVELKMSQV